MEAGNQLHTSVTFNDFHTCRKNGTKPRYMEEVRIMGTSIK
jgi:hypothetical protein